MLRDGESHNYRLSTRLETLIEIENRGRATIASVYDANGELVLRGANWRSIEGRYRILIPANVAARITIEPDQPVAPPGEYQVSMVGVLSSDVSRAAEASMTGATNLLLQHFFGEADSRTDAIKQYQTAAAQFEAARDQARLADALFELGGAFFNSGEHDEASEAYGRALDIWTGATNQRGVAATKLMLGLIAWRTNGLDEAITYFEDVSRIRRGLGDDFFEAQAQNNIGLVYRQLNDARSAITFFERALAVWQGDLNILGASSIDLNFETLDRPPWLFDSLVAMNNIAWAAELVGDYERSRRLLSLGIEIADRSGQSRIGARMQANLGRIEYKFGQFESSLRHFDAALRYFMEVSPDEIWAADIHHGTADVFTAVGDALRAAAELKQALRLRTEERDPVSRAETILALAELQLSDRRPADALESATSARRLLRPDNYNLAARSESLVGRAYRLLEQAPAALRSHNAAISLYGRAKNVRGRANTLIYRAELHTDVAAHALALKDWNAALEISRQVEDRSLEFRAQSGLARTFALIGDYDKSIETATTALNLSKTLRFEIRHPSLLRYFASTERDTYDVLIYSYLATDQTEAAFAASDQSRAQRVGESIRREFDSAPNAAAVNYYWNLVYQRATLADELSAKLDKALSDDSQELVAEIESIRLELARVVGQIDQFAENIDRSDSVNASFVDLRDVRDVIGDAILVEFHIGDLSSGAWVVGQNDFDYYSIAATENLAQDIEELLAAIRRRENARANVDRLSTQLLGNFHPGTLAARRLIVVPDGPLHGLPFALLNDPSGESDGPLLHTAVISYSPSASSLLALAERAPSAGTGVAVVADPIFGRDDPRLAAAADSNTAAPDRILLRGSGDDGRRRFARLPFTAAEGESIRAVAKAREEVTLITGADASLANVISGDLSGFRLVHFATHGVVDVEEPALSGLVFSNYSSDGSPQPQFLRAQDVDRLGLTAELVVLSACDTGVGRIIHGEGIDSLSRSFLGAGANSVVSTLWQVPDQATAALMEAFYGAMFQDGLPPAEALAVAQRSIMLTDRWSSPFYWAAFTLQGRADH